MSGVSKFRIVEKNKKKTTCIVHSFIYLYINKYMTCDIYAYDKYVIFISNAIRNIFF